ncbi:hypothetical protein GJ496_008209 [Pomphorhynchus laevis]|nr:hypothetical protein GJ496_008209 [Pomphorhynchus laevis]
MRIKCEPVRCENCGLVDVWPCQNIKVWLKENYPVETIDELINNSSTQQRKQSRKKVAAEKKQWRRDYKLLSRLSYQIPSDVRNDLRIHLCWHFNSLVNAILQPTLKHLICSPLIDNEKH